MMHVVQVFQPSLNGLGQEVAQVEVPGEIWPAIEALADRDEDMFLDYCPMELESTSSCARTVNIDLYLERRCNSATSPVEPNLEIIAPYVQGAMDMGYSFVILTA